MNSKLTYETKMNVTVFLDGKIAGHIQPCNDGYAYFPKGGKRGSHGDIMPTVAAVKRSLESE